MVLIEKFADVIIADHLKNDAPVGSVSWKFVDDSVKAGQIQNINNYKKHTSNTTNASRPTRTLFSTSKPTRTPFSAEDDRLLTQWVLDQERLGERPHGTKIYQEFSERVGGVGTKSLPFLVLTDLQSTHITHGSHGENGGSSVSLFFHIKIDP